MSHRPAYAARSEDRERLSDKLDIWRRRHGAEWALTLALGVSPLRPFDSENLKPHLRRLFHNVAHEVFPMSVRQRKNMTIATCPIFFAGVYESHDKYGRPWPHIHGCIALKGQPEALLRGVLRDRWGEDEDSEQRAFIGVDMVATMMPSQAVAPRSVITRPSYRPSFCLRPIHSDYWFGTYSTKVGDIRNLSLWNAPDILNLQH